MKQNIIVSLTVLLLSSSAFAEKKDSVITRDISISKDYVPEIMKVKRADIALPSTEPDVPRLEVNYSDYKDNLTVTSPFYPVKSAEMNALKLKPAKSGYAKAGFGFPFNWIGELFYPVVESGNTHFDVGMWHNGATTGVKKLIESDLKLNFEQRFNKSILYSSLSYSNDYFSYYGTDSINQGDPSFFYLVNNQKVRADSLPLSRNQALNNLHFDVGYKSLQDYRGFNYNAKLAYNLFGAQSSGLREHQVSGDFEIGTLLWRHPISAQVKVDHFIYQTPHQVSDSLFKNNTTISLLPKYNLIWKNINVKLGAKLFFNFNKGTGFAITPDVAVDYQFKQLFNVYAGIGGDYKLNSVAETMSENRYLNPYERARYNTWTPFDFFGGITIKPATGFMADFNVSYKVINNDYFFTNTPFECITTPNTWPQSDSEWTYSNLFSASFANATLFTAATRLSYNFKERYQLYFNMKYNGWNVSSGDGVAWHEPAWKINTGINAQVIDPLKINLSYNFESARSVKLIQKDGSFASGSLRPIHDLNLGATWMFKGNWGLFAQFNNLLGASKQLNYQTWNGYDTLGFNALFGATIQF